MGMARNSVAPREILPIAFHPNQIARILVQVARGRQTITYTDLGTELGRSGSTPGLGLGSDLDACQDWLKKNDLPPLTVLVVRKETGKPSPDGIFYGRKFSDISDEEITALQTQCFEYVWTDGQLRALGVTSS